MDSEKTTTFQSAFAVFVEEMDKYAFGILQIIGMPRRKQKNKGKTSAGESFV